MPVEVEQGSGRRSVMMRFVFDDITRIKKNKAGNKTTRVLHTNILEEHPNPT